MIKAVWGVAVALVASTGWTGTTPADVPEPQYDTLEGLAFLAGCWEGPFGNGSGTMEEFYTSASRNLILGTTRYMRNGAAVQFEFTRIQLVDGAIVMTPYPGGRPSEDSFTLTTLQNGEAIFEAPEHDYPKRIIYRTVNAQTRIARIDGGADDPRPTEWELRAVACSND